MKVLTGLNWVAALRMPGKEESPTEQSVFNRYDTAINESWQIGEHHMVAAMMPVASTWEPGTHDDLVYSAFPGLSDWEVRSIALGSQDVDMKGGLLPVTLLEKNAYKHAMTPGEKVREYMKAGMSQAQAVEKGKEWAKDEAQKFIKEQGEKAKKWMEKAKSTTNREDKQYAYRQALIEFGRGAHTLMDDTSPAHYNFQVYETESYKAKSIISLADGIGDFVKDTIGHKHAEAGPPTAEEKAKSDQALRSYFKEVFGEAAANRALDKNRAQNRDWQKGIE
jgi:hypothetical protein